MPNVATPVTASVLEKVPVVNAPAAGVTLPIALGLANKDVNSNLLVALTLPSIGKKSSPANVVAVAETPFILVVAIIL